MSLIVWAILFRLSLSLYFRSLQVYKYIFERELKRTEFASRLRKKNAMIVLCALICAWCWFGIFDIDICNKRAFARAAGSSDTIQRDKNQPALNCSKM